MIVRRHTDRVLADQQAVATWCTRAPSVVLRRCDVVAVDVETRRGLYDAEASREVLDALPRRDRRAAV